mmetsp:Transcript_49545/g.107985  ORF Transcript_49545/g.107985 Transcript_49545/m.107985 type:complete len:84 (+) Transcript_49545:360-611(+)
MLANGVAISATDLDARPGQMEPSMRVAGPIAQLLGMVDSSSLMDLSTWANGVETAFMAMELTIWRMDHPTMGSGFTVIEMVLA